jgi:hypothetical protein
MSMREYMFKTSISPQVSEMVNLRPLIADDDSMTSDLQ